MIILVCKLACIQSHRIFTGVFLRHLIISAECKVCIRIQAACISTCTFYNVSIALCRFRNTVIFLVGLITSDLYNNFIGNRSNFQFSHRGLYVVVVYYRRIQCEIKCVGRRANFCLSTSYLVSKLVSICSYQTIDRQIGCCQCLTVINLISGWAGQFQKLLANFQGIVLNYEGNPTKVRIVIFKISR